MHIIDYTRADEYMYPPGYSDPKEVLTASFYVLPWVTSHGLIPLQSDMVETEIFTLYSHGMGSIENAEREGFVRETY